MLLKVHDGISNESFLNKKNVDKIFKKTLKTFITPISVAGRADLTCVSDWPAAMIQRQVITVQRFSG